MANATLLDIAKLNNNDRLVGLIEENLTSAPELNWFPTRSKPGTTYTTNVRTGFPSVGFRSANAGFTPAKSSFDKRQVQMFIFGGAIQVDRSVADAYEEGRAAWEMIEASGVTKNAMIKLGSQIWYGTSADSAGFAGIKTLTPKTGQGSTITVDATGTTASTASSLYAVKFGIQDCILPVGMNGQLTLGDFREQQIADPNDSTKVIPALVSDLSSWIGLQVGNANCVGRILNLTADSGKGLTDSLIAQLLAKFPVGYTPDALFCSRRSRRQLQISRTVVIQGGPGNARAGGNVENVPPIPDNAFGIPLIATDSILDTDTVE